MGAASIAHVTQRQSRVASAAGRGGQLCGSKCPFPFLGLSYPLWKMRDMEEICFFAFLFLGDGLDPCLLYSVTNLRP